jgi:dihydrofolate reductase
MISMIAAIGKNRELGVKNRIPWHIKEDLLRFKRLTLNKPVIVGRKTFESLLGYYKKSQRPFPKRYYFIVTRDINYSPDMSGVIDSEGNKYIVTSSVEDAVNKAKETTQDEVFIIGGASIYHEGIKYADKLYLTLIDKSVPDADAFFPEYSSFKNKVFEENHQDNDPPYVFADLIR